jgi:hypothetical protein
VGKTEVKRRSEKAAKGISEEKEVFCLQMSPVLSCYILPALEGGSVGGLMAGFY